MPLLKPFRALRYDTDKAGELDSLVAPPYDVIDAEMREKLLGASPYNTVRLIRPHEPDEAAHTLGEWQESGILRRDEDSSLWIQEEDFVGLDGVARTRTGVIGCVQVEPYSTGKILPHERTFAGPKKNRLELLRATRVKLSPLLFLHAGDSIQAPRGRSADLEAVFESSRTRLWRLGDREATQFTERLATPFIIGDGHHRYETALDFHAEDGCPETCNVLGVLVSRADPGLAIFPTHRVVTGAAPELNGDFKVTPVGDDIAEGLSRLARMPRNEAAFLYVRRNGTVLAERPTPDDAPLRRLDTVAIDELDLEGVTFTASTDEAVGAVRAGVAEAALLVRAPTVEEVESVVLAGETMPAKSTYFYPKLLSGLLFSPFDD